MAATQRTIDAPADVSAAWKLQRQQANDAIRTQVGDRTRNEQTPYLLRGHIYCGRCGCKMWPNWTHRGGKMAGEKYRTYRCSGDRAPAYHCGQAQGAEKIEAWGRIEHALRNPDLVAAELKRRQADGPDATLSADLTHARRQVRSREQKAKLAMEEYMATQSDEGQNGMLWQLLKEQIAKLEREREQWAKTVSEIETRMAEQQADTLTLEGLHRYCERVATNLATFDFAGKSLAVAALKVRVTVDGPIWDIDGLIPLDGPDGPDGTDGTPAGDVLMPNSQDWRYRPGA